MKKIILLAFFCLPIIFAAKTIDKGYTVGDTVKNFTLKSVNGKDISLSDYKKEKGIILIFDCNTCPFSKAYNERIKELHSMYASKGFPVLAINSNDPKRQPDDSFDKMKSYAKEHNYKHAYVQDVDQAVAHEFGATNTPHVYVLQQVEGNFKVAYIGAIDNNTKDAEAADKKYVQSAVNALLNGDEPEITHTKAIGCTIKWKE